MKFWETFLDWLFGPPVETSLKPHPINALFESQESIGKIEKKRMEEEGKLTHKKRKKNGTTKKH